MYIPAVMLLFRNEGTFHHIMHMPGTSFKSQQADILKIQNMMDHLNKLKGNEDHWGRQEECFFWEGEINRLRKVRNDFFQGHYGPLDRLETERLLIPARDIIEDIDRC